MVSIGGRPAPAGGLLGSWGASGLTGAFGAVGGPLFALTAALLALVLVTKVSIARVARSAWAMSVETFRYVRTAFARWREQRRKAKQRRTVIQKYSARRTAAEEVPEPDEEPKERGPLLTVKVPVTAS